MIKITLITVTYNAGGVIQRTLDSVLSQTYAKVEHIVVDGKSKDDTVSRALKYKEVSAEEAPGHDVIVQSEPDHGLYDAMNKGLRMATGDYVCFLNAGDFLPSDDTLELVARTAAASAGQGGADHLPAVVYGDTDWVDNEGRYLRGRRLGAPERLTWRSFRCGMLVCHQAFYARTDIAKATPFDTRYRLSADVDWCIRVMKEAELKGLPLVNVHAVVVNYQREGASTASHRASLMERFSVMRRHYGLITTVIMHCWFVVRAFVKK